MSLRKWCIGILLFVSVSAQAQLSNGIYAVFHTSLGSITSLLHHAEAPINVANFVGLAEGSRAWREESTQLVRQYPFYDGQIVNRIADLISVAGTAPIIQSGSQNGTNLNGGPGYTLRDEVNTEFTHTTGSISMGNKGNPHTSGSQFFFCLGDLPHLDGQHSLFGQVVSGLDVLQAIYDAPRAGVKPDTDIVFNQVEILRIGTNALAFDVNAYSLPTVDTAEGSISLLSNDTLQIAFPQTNTATHALLDTPDMANWTTVWSNTDPYASPSQTFILALPDSFGAVSMTRVIYSIFLPPGSDILIGTFTDPDGSLTINVPGNSINTTNGLTGTIASGSLWGREVYHGRFSLNTSGTTPSVMDLNFTFTNAISGIYEGTYSTGESVDGTFNFTTTPP